MIKPIRHTPRVPIQDLDFVTCTPSHAPPPYPTTLSCSATKSCLGSVFSWVTWPFVAVYRWIAAFFCPQKKEDTSPKVRTYDSINVTKMNEQIKVLQDGESEEQLKLAREVNANPGNYAPPVLIYAAYILISIKEFQAGAILQRGGLLRADADLFSSRDETLSHVLGPYYDAVFEVREEFSGEEDIVFEKAKSEAIANLEEWERKTPYHYDMDWMKAQSEHAGKGKTFLTANREHRSKLIAYLCKKVRQENPDELYCFVLKGDTFYFNEFSRQYQVKPNLHFKVPKNFLPEVSRYGKLIDRINIGKSFSAWLNLNTWESSKKIKNFNEYQRDGATIEQLNSGIRYCHRRTFYREHWVHNHYYFVEGFCTYHIELQCNRSREDAILKEFQPLLESIKL